MKNEKCEMGNGTLSYVEDTSSPPAAELPLKGKPLGGESGALRAVGSARAYYYNTICKVTEEELPREYKAAFLPNVLDQGYVNSCVAHGVAGALSANHLKHTGELIDLSVLLIYGLWRGDMTGEGMFVESTLNNGREIGTSPREYAPENLEVPEAITKAKEYAKEYPNAMAFKVGSFYKMRQNENFVSDVKKALYQYNLPLVTVKEGTPRHCELIVGWDEDNFILQNSYGESYGDGGYHKIPITTKNLDDTYLVLAEKVKLPFSDTEGHWAEKYIRNVYFAGLMEGYPDGTFAPDKAVTRAELAKVIDEVLRDIDEKLKKLEMRNE
ncbi:MAG: S-layer homology domain-containing protein [Clostridia bacterium]|nr:S-layer homology domain-containing protein [Clostridia bacterium]